MGLHQDKDEGAASLDAGLPVVSVSLGDTARFLFGGLRRRDPVESILLESGDVFVFGGPSRRRYHGCDASPRRHGPRVARPRRSIQPHVPAVRAGVTARSVVYASTYSIRDRGSGTEWPSSRRPATCIRMAP